MTVTMDEDALRHFTTLLSVGQVDGAHHKTWVLDQIARLMLGEDYHPFVVAYMTGEDGPHTYEWDEGTPP